MALIRSKPLSCLLMSITTKLSLKRRKFRYYTDKICRKYFLVFGVGTKNPKLPKTPQNKILSQAYFQTLHKLSLNIKEFQTTMVFISTIY